MVERRALSRLGDPRHRYGLLLLLILVSLGFQLAAPDGDGARFVTILLQGLTLQLALRMSGANHWIVRVATIVIAITIVAAAIALLGIEDVGAGPARITTLLLVVMAPPAIALGVLREFRLEGRVTLHTMFGVLCIYLLIGMTFAVGYGIVEVLSDDPFFAQTGTDAISNFLYFSYTTITTTGYGDLTAATDVGRALAITEQLIGQIYLVTVVALIVGNLARARPRADA